MATEFSKAANNADSVVEDIKYFDRYVALIILGSINYAIGPILDEAIAATAFIESYYYLSTGELPGEEEIFRLLENGDDNSNIMEDPL